MRNVGRHYYQKFVGRNQANGRFESLKRFTERDVFKLIAVFIIGFLAAYSANAAVSPPSQADWDAWNKLKPVKKFNYDKVYDEIDTDLAQLDGRAEMFAQNLPLQATGPMNALAKKHYRGRAARVK